MTVRPNSLAARDAAYLLHPYTNAEENERIGPLVMARGEGVYVWDDDGNKYLESMAGLWCASLGFGNERLAQAAYDQMRTLDFAYRREQLYFEILLDIRDAMSRK